ncbi:MAG: hypothetical protein CMC97_06205 [Flavobacteriales bacterium]|nr:hypothetical protein [Flavobacteriales bacterium]
MLSGNLHFQLRTAGASVNAGRWYVITSCRLPRRLAQHGEYAEDTRHVSSLFYASHGIFDQSLSVHVDALIEVSTYSAR